MFDKKSKAAINASLTLSNSGLPGILKPLLAASIFSGAILTILLMNFSSLT